MIKQEDVFRIGRIGKPHGVKGEVSFHFDDDIFDRTDADYVILDIDGTFVPFFFDEYRFRSDETALVKFSDIDSTEKAKQLTGCDVYFERCLAPNNEDDELSWNEIVGFIIIDDKSDKTIGTVTAVDLSTINTLFNVLTPEGKEVLIPAADEFVNDINRQHKQLRMTLPEGLLDI